MTLPQTASAEKTFVKPKNVVSYFCFQLQNNWQQLVLCAVFCFLIMFLPILLGTVEPGSHEDFYSYNMHITYEEMLRDRAVTMTQTLGVLFTLSAGLIGVIFGMTANGYTNGKPSVHTYFSFPLRRTTLFMIEWLTRDVYFLSVGTLFFVLSAGYIALRLTFSADIFAKMALFWLIGICGYFMVFHLLQLAASLTGTASFRFCMAGILAFLPGALYLLLIGCISEGMPSIWADYYISTSVFRYLCPAYLLWDTAYQFSVFSTISGIIVMAVYTVLFAVLSIVLQAKRKSELSGSSVVWKFFQNLVKYLVIFTCGIFGGWVVTLFGNKSVTWSVFGLICGLVLSFILMNVLIERSAKGMFRGIVGFGVTGTVTVLIFASLFFDLFGLNGFMYADNKVDRIQVAFEYGLKRQEYVTITDPDDVHALMEDIRHMRNWPYGTEYEKSVFYVDRDKSVTGTVPSMLKTLSGYAVSIYNDDITQQENIYTLREEYPEAERYAYGGDALQRMTVWYIVYPKCGLPLAKCTQIEILTETDGFGEKLSESREYREYLVKRISEMDPATLQIGYVMFGNRIFELIDGKHAADPQFNAMVDAYRTSVLNGEMEGTVVGKIVFQEKKENRWHNVELPVYSDMTNVWQSFLAALDAELFYIDDVRITSDEDVLDTGKDWREIYEGTDNDSDFSSYLERTYTELLVVEAGTGRYWYVSDDADRAAVLSSAAAFENNCPSAIGYGKCDPRFLLAALSWDGELFFTGIRYGEVPVCVTDAFHQE